MVTLAPLLFLLAATAAHPAVPRLSIDVKDANVLDLVRLLADVGGFQAVADPGVSCTLTLALKDVAWPTVLDVALRSCGLAEERDGNVVRVAPASRLLAEAAERRQLDEAQRLNRPLRTEVYRLSYARAADLAPLLRKHLSARGSVEFDARTNTLFVTDVAP
jgi:type IV pilus assembly protein PilQ